MNPHSIRKPAFGTPLLRRSFLAGLFPLVGVAGATAAAPAAPEKAPCACAGAMYSVINLDPEGGAAAFLNEKGQAAVGSFVFGTNSFFDGERIHPLGSLGAGFTVIKGLNDRGVVAGESLDDAEPFGNYYPFTWTLARGMRIVPGALSGQVWGINNRNQLVGIVPVPGVSGRAARFEPGGAVTPLGPLPFSLSEGRAISDAGITGGYTDYADGSIRASVWSAAGVLSDLGTLSGGRAFTLHVNERGDAAGYSDDPTNTDELGFFWSRGGGMVPIGSRNGGARLVADLNDRGDVVGITTAGATATAYQWSRARGLVWLPRAGALESDVFDINNRGEMVGGLWRAGSWRAALWRGLTAPVDLNTRLHRIPAGLVLERAAAINESGTILAYSNAGLVMLRPGARGTDAPVLGPVTGLPDSVTLGDEVRASISFIFNAPGQVHAAVADWGDGCVSPAPLVTEAYGRGNVGFQHRFCAPGFQTLVLRVTDSGGRSTETRRQVLVNAPGQAAVSGRGKLAAAAGGPGSGRPLPLQFALWAPLAQGDTRGKPVLALQGPFAFRSDSVAAARDGAHVKLEGTGRYNGRAGYRFVVDAVDGAQGAQGANGAVDRMRVRISHRDAAGVEVVEYDSAGMPQAGKDVSARAGGGDGLAKVEGAIVLRN